jgi:tripartite-type tricarboxylate transporter receptor subunit TctC
MLVLRTLSIAIVTAVVLAVGAGASQAQNAFYKGKRLSILVNYAAGGPTDIEGRLLARHIARHIDGQPNIVVQNMDGAGGLVGTNWLGEVAPRDGSVMGYTTGAAWLYASDPAHYRVDFLTYEFIAYQPGTSVYFVRTDVEPRLKASTDLLKVKNLVSGGLSADSNKDLLMRLALDMLGMPYRHVTGYRSNTNARLALQRNEINFFSESPPGYRSVVEPTLVKNGTVIPTWYDPGWDGESMKVPRQIEGLTIPPFHEFYQSVRSKPPTGQLWEVYLASLAVNSAMQRLLVLPPGAPAVALDALRTAVRELNNDRAFAEEAMKVIGFVPEYVATPETGRQVRSALKVKPEIRAFVANYIKNPKK